MGGATRPPAPDARVSASHVCVALFGAREPRDQRARRVPTGDSRIASRISEISRLRFPVDLAFTIIATALAEFDRDLTSEHRDYVFFQIYGPYTGNSPPQWVMRDSWLTHTCDITRHSELPDARAQRAPQRRAAFRGVPASARPNSTPVKS